VAINGIEMIFPDQKPIIVNDRTLVPVRGVFEILGYEVEWVERGDNPYVLLAKVGEFITMGMNDDFINVNFMPVPLRMVAYVGTVIVNWDAVNFTVTMETIPGLSEVAKSR
jgi:hypothetical protein